MRISNEFAVAVACGTIFLFLELEKKREEKEQEMGGIGKGGKGIEEVVPRASANLVRQSQALWGKPNGLDIAICAKQLG